MLLMPIAFAQTRISGPLRGRATFGLVAEPSYDLPAICIRRTCLTADMGPNRSREERRYLPVSPMRRRISVDERQVEVVSRLSHHHALSCLELSRNRLPLRKIVAPPGWISGRGKIGPFRLLGR